VILFDFNDTYSHGVYAFVTLLAHVNAALNPYVYIFLNPGFKETFKKKNNFNNSISISLCNTGKVLNYKGKNVVAETNL
jgi:hypothetical protein